MRCCCPLLVLALASAGPACALGNPRLSDLVNLLQWDTEVVPGPPSGPGDAAAKPPQKEKRALAKDTRPHAAHPAPSTGHEKPPGKLGEVKANHVRAPASGQPTLAQREARWRARQAARARAAAGTSKAKEEEDGPPKHIKLDGPEVRVLQAAKRGGIGGVAEQQPLINFGDALYATWIRMGKKVIIGLIDTRSSELVIFGDEGAVGSTDAYRPSASKSFKEGQLRLHHELGSAEGESAEAYESISLGPFQPVSQMFWLSRQAMTPPVPNVQMQALIGVGPPDAPLIRAWSITEQQVLNVTSLYEHGYEPPEEMRQETHELLAGAVGMGSGLRSSILDNWNCRSFSICLGAKPGQDGVIFWNDKAHLEHPEAFFRVQLLSKYSWAANLSKPAMQSPRGSEVALAGCEAGCEAVLDSSSSLLAVPGPILRQIAEQLDDLGLQCESLEQLPDLSIELGGTELRLPPSAYVARVLGKATDQQRQAIPRLADNGNCSLLLYDSGADNLWVLGVPFFRAFYATFDIGQTPSDRALFVANHSDDECRPVSQTVRLLGAPEMQARRVEVQKLRVPRATRPLYLRGV